MPLPLGPQAQLRFDAMGWATGLLVAAGVGIGPALARDFHSQPFSQQCDPALQGCGWPMAAASSQQLQPPSTVGQQPARAERAERQWPGSPVVAWTGAELAQAFGRPAQGPYPGQPNNPAYRPGGFPAPGPMPGPAATPPANISFPAAGVICDQIYKLCYNNQGVSQSLSAVTFGQAGFASAMLAIQRGLQKQFLLSNGTFCDVSVPACWSDGMARRIPSAMMSSQLFYGVNTGPAIYPGAGGGNFATSGYATCRLQQGFQVLYNGQCQLTRQPDGNRLRFNAQLGNGMVYSFVNRNGGYRIRDNGGGIWPVSYVDQGGSGMFTWANYSLMLTQPGYRGGANPGRSLDNLLQSLFQ